MTQTLSLDVAFQHVGEPQGWAKKICIAVNSRLGVTSATDRGEVCNAFQHVSVNHQWAVSRAVQSPNPSPFPSRHLTVNPHIGLAVGLLVNPRITAYWPSQCAIYSYPAYPACTQCSDCVAWANYKLERLLGTCHVRLSAADRWRIL